MIPKLIIFTTLLILIFILILSILFIYLVFRKHEENKHVHVIKQIQLNEGHRLFNYLYKGEFSRSLVPKENDKFLAIEDLLTKFGTMVNSIEVNKRISSYTETYFSKKYRKLLSHRRWSIRMNVLYNIEDFQMRSLKPDVIKLLKKRMLTNEEKIQILRILASFDTENFASILLAAKPKLTPYASKEILTILNKENFHSFIIHFEQCPFELQMAMIDCIGEHHMLAYGTFIEQLLTHSKIEFRTSALKAISYLGKISSHQHILPFVHSQNWQERLMVCKVLGAIRDESFIPLLKKLMCDKSWWVRFQAGKSILKYKDYRKILESIIEQSDDHYASDMAKQCLQEKG
jgi:hypothetical protein